jgi:hypothetical protein
MACNMQHGKRNMQSRCSLPFCLRVEIVPPEKAKKQELGLKLTFNVVNLAGATKHHSAVKEGSFAQARRCQHIATQSRGKCENGVLSVGTGTQCSWRYSAQHPVGSTARSAGGLEGSRRLDSVRSYHPPQPRSTRCKVGAKSQLQYDRFQHDGRRVGCK